MRSALWAVLPGGIDDPATPSGFNLDSPPWPWIDLGWVENFQRSSTTRYDALRAGASANITAQYRTQPEAHVEFDLLSWGKVQLALSGGTQQMNVLAAGFDDLKK